MSMYTTHPGFAIDSRTEDAYRTDVGAALKAPLYGLRVLDLGCGSGTFSRFLEACGMRVTGIDSDSEALKAARDHAQNAKFIRVDIESADEIARMLPAQHSFDLLAARYVIHELADPIETFQLWKRLLKPTGRLLLIENVWIRTDWGWGEWGKRSDHLPLACTQTWATAVYCLQKAGFTVSYCDWMHTVNRLEAVRSISGFRLYIIVAEMEAHP